MVSTITYLAAGILGTIFLMVGYTLFIVLSHRNKVLAVVHCQDNWVRNQWVKPKQKLRLKGAPGEGKGLYTWDPRAVELERGRFLSFQRVTYDEGVPGPRVLKENPGGRASYHPDAHQLGDMEDAKVIKDTFYQGWDATVIIFIIALVLMAAILLYLISTIQDLQTSLAETREAAQGVMLWMTR